MKILLAVVLAASVSLSCLALADDPKSKPDPNSASIKETKHEENATFYEVVWDTPQAVDEIEVNTVNWYQKGQITITNWEDTESDHDAKHDHNDKDVSPTTENVEPTVERLTLTDKEKKWVATGKIRVLVRNDHGVGPGHKDVQPTILTVKYVPRAK